MSILLIFSAVIEYRILLFTNHTRRLTLFLSDLSGITYFSRYIISIQQVSMYNLMEKCSTFFQCESQIFCESSKYLKLLRTFYL